MITKRRLALLSTISAAPVFAAPFLAIGENAELFLTARTEARYEDNVTFSSDNEIKDEVFEVVPGAELLFGKNSLTKGSFKAFERLVAFSDNTNLNSDLANLVFDSKYSGAKLDLGANASFRELNQNSRDTANATTLVRRDTYAAGLNGEYALTEKSKVGLAGRYDRTHYKVDPYVDQTNYTIPANYYFAVTEKVDLSAGVQYRKNEVDALNADSDDYYFNVGSRGEFTAKLSGKFNVGYNIRKPQASGADDETGLGLNAGLAYAYSPKTNLTLDISRDFGVASTAAGTEISSVMFGATTSLTASWSVSANLGYYQYDYLAGGRTDDYIIAGLGATYAYNEYVNFEAGYTFNDNSSDSASANFSANVIRFAANFRY
jgi:hypothetical protein